MFFLVRIPESLRTSYVEGPIPRLLIAQASAHRRPNERFWKQSITADLFSLINRFDNPSVPGEAIHLQIMMKLSTYTSHCPTTSVRKDHTCSTPDLDQD